MDQLICQTEKGKQKVEKGPLGFRKKSHTSTSGCIGSVCEAVINQGIVESKVPISWHLLYFFTEGTVRERNIKKKKKIPKGASLVAQLVKNLPAMQKIQV